MILCSIKSIRRRLTVWACRRWHRQFHAPDLAPDIARRVNVAGIMTALDPDCMRAELVAVLQPGKPGMIAVEKVDRRKFDLYTGIGRCAIAGFRKAARLQGGFADRLLHDLKHRLGVAKRSAPCRCADRA